MGVYRLEQALASWLLAQLPVAALLGDRLYPLVLPQAGGLPAATWQRIGADIEYDLDGPAGLERPLVQIDCWAASFADARGLAGAIREVLHGYSGPMGDLTVQRVVIEREADEYEAETQLYRCGADYRISVGA